MSNLKRLFRKVGPVAESTEFKSLRKTIFSLLEIQCRVDMEYCYYIESNSIILAEAGHQTIEIEDSSIRAIVWVIAETFEPDLLRFNKTFFCDQNECERIVEIGPRLAFSTAWCSNCLSMLQACGVYNVRRIERARRIKFNFESSPSEAQMTAIVALLYDRMTECVYPAPLTSFGTEATPEPVRIIPVLELGREAIETENAAKGLGFDSWDLDVYTRMFAETLQRNPTDVELFDLGQSNSEHSRHWFFNGKIHVDGVPQPETLFQIVKSTLLPTTQSQHDAASASSVAGISTNPASATLAASNSDNSIIAFHDNSSAIRGCEVPVLLPSDPSSASQMVPATRLLHPILTAETHNFPCGVAPFAGAETGTGGRIRDVQATGRGAHTLAGVCGYCVGNLHIPDHPLPWEQPRAASSPAVSPAALSPPAVGGSAQEGQHLQQQAVHYPGNLASPLNIIVQASNGASDYGNKFGEPVVTGFARSYGQQIRYEYTHPRSSSRTSENENQNEEPLKHTQVQRVEWLKPVMFTAGVGLLDDQHCSKGAPEPGMLVCKIGGPAYRIGVGGGAASSRVQQQQKMSSAPAVADMHPLLLQPNITPTTTATKGTTAAIANQNSAAQPSWQEMTDFLDLHMEEELDKQMEECEAQMEENDLLIQQMAEQMQQLQQHVHQTQQTLHQVQQQQQQLAHMPEQIPQNILEQTQEQIALQGEQLQMVQQQEQRIIEKMLGVRQKMLQIQERRQQMQEQIQQYEQQLQQLQQLQKKPQKQQSDDKDNEDFELDFNAVQRGDAEMENRMNRVLRACIELGNCNPIVSIHDQGAGGNGNVLKEIVEPLGARIHLADIPSGDPTLSALELWGAEYQENNALLVRAGLAGDKEGEKDESGMSLLQRIAARENCPFAAVGTITGDGWMVAEAHDGSTPYNLPLSLSLEPESAAGEEGKEEKSKKMPQKEFHFTSPPPGFLPAPLQLPLQVSPSLTLSAPQQQSRKRGMSSSDAPPTDAPQQLGEEGVPLLALASDTSCEQTAPVPLPEPTAVVEALLGRVLRLLDVGSKRFLTNKVDRSVTGLVAQQQCVGPLHTPLADVAVLAQSHFATTGIAVAVGEQPIKGLVSPAAQARLTVCEALSNLVFADITSLADVKASCNWMWPAKVTERLPAPALSSADHGMQEKEGIIAIEDNVEGNMEGARMYQACSALRDCMRQLGVGIDGGKDSLTMAAKVGEEVVKCPGQMVLTCYALCRDITHTLTPDFKHPGKGVIVYVDLGEGHYRLGGTALSTVHAQLGRSSPDLTPSAQCTFQRCFLCIQECLRQGLLQAGHDRSDGGLATTLLEMAFAGNTGLRATLREDWHTTGDADTEAEAGYIQGKGPVGSIRQDQKLLPCVPLLFSEEAGFVLEVLPEDLPQVLAAFAQAEVPAHAIGTVTADKMLDLQCVPRRPSADSTPNDTYPVLQGDMTQWRDVWESTSFALERLQCDEDCVRQEMAGLRTRTTPPHHLTYTPQPFAPLDTAAAADSTTALNTHHPGRPLQAAQHRVAILRQEGTNGDREMASAFHLAGFEVWDVSMRDLRAGSVTLDAFRGLAFCGGFSYADVNDSAKGWAGSILFHPRLLQQFCAFRDRTDTFSLGVCNGCQLLALLGWVPFETAPSADASGKQEEQCHQPPQEQQPRFVRNLSGRFESRWSAVTVLPSPAVLLQGMEGSTLGIWVSHGEGRAYFPHSAHLDAVLQQRLAPLRYVADHSGIPTEEYPCNPNGSPQGIAALCSPSGRHLAFMPHPERCFLKWQIPYHSVEDKLLQRAAPWVKLFQNAKLFCDTVPAAGNC